MERQRKIPSPQAIPARRDLSLLDWTLKYRALLAPDRPFVPHPWLRDLYRDENPEIVIYKAAQLGASEYLISWMLWAADIRVATGLYVFPTDTHVSDFSAARLGPAIEKSVSPFLAQIIVSGGPGDSRGADRVGLKRVHNRFIYFRGARVKPDGSAPQLKSIDADALVLDEYDEMDVRAPAIARKRLEASKFAQIRMASTPTFPDMGIHAEYQRSDCRRWYIRCGSCNKFTSPTLDDLVTEWDALERPVRWHTDANDQPYLRCPHCGGALDRESGEGEWVAEYPSRDVHGYHLFRLALPGKPLRVILDDLDTTDETKRQQAVNQGLGLPYTPSTAQSMSDAVLQQCRREYANGVPVPGETAYAGIDVGRVLHVCIRAKAPDGTRPLRFAGTVDSFEEAGRLLRKFNVRTCVVDALPETRAVRGLQGAFPRFRVWLAYYTESGETTKREQLGTWDEKDGTVNVDRTRSLDETFSYFHNAASDKADEPRNTLPANIAAVRDYFAHLKAPKRILRKDAKGTQVAVYVESGPDHYAHAENYCALARTCPLGNVWVGGTRR